MNFWRQLRWRIVIAHMAVVIVGVVVLALTAELIAASVLANEVLPLLAPDVSAITAQVGDTLRAGFSRVVNKALLVAALAATLAGFATSLLLMREILRPLRQIARSSRRIAAGHYDERVSTQTSDELAAVATSFNQMAATLEQIEQQRITLIGNVAHELRTPLAGLEGYLEGLVDGVLPNEPETLNAMQQEVRRLKRLVNDLQSLARAESGQVPLHPETFDLVALTRRIVAQIQPQIIAQCLAMPIEHPPAPLLVYADADRVAQVLLNLIGNAIQHTPRCGCITVRLTTADGMAQVSVSDNGAGIPAETLPYLFERFYRVDRSRARSSGGSGIGLTIARHLVWAMGGEISATSPGPGQGSTFTFTLPLAGARLYQVV